MQKIMVAVDGSKDADKAFEVAAGLAKQLGSEMMLITVIDDLPPLDSEGRPVYDATSLAVQREAENMLSEYAVRAKQKFDLETDTSVWRGFPSKTIVEVAEEKDVGMIVIGSRGLGGLKELMLGSVSHAVAKSSKVPVLIVK